MNIMQLKYFVAVCTYKKVSEAAKVLHISQPSLSNAIKELENEFGIILFNRRYAGMELTAEGKTFLELANGILEKVNRTEHVMSDLGTKRKVMKLGVPPMIGALILPHIFKYFCSDNPDIVLEITESGREELIISLLSGELDAMFIPHTEPLGNVFSKSIAKLEIVCAVSADNVLSQKETLTFTDLSDVPLVLFKNSFFQTEQIKQKFLLAGVTPNIVLQTEQLSTIQTLVKNNLCAGFMFRELINSESDIYPIPMEDSMYVDVSIAWGKNQPQTDAVKRFFEYVSKYNILLKR